MIMKEFSNFSAWHYRTKVIEQIHTASPPEDFIAAEFDLLKNAYFTCPYDQSVWNYHRWLFAKVSPIRIASMHLTPNTVGPTVPVGDVRLKIGLTVPVCDVGPGCVTVTVGEEVVAGTWAADNPYSYIWTFTPDGGMGEVGEFTV